ncbi:hypothetical protein FVER53590_12348 [Fusarium verticillioides]|nr:hypothetical protein FVER53590_12348 [Fusarium verticillioides]
MRVDSQIFERDTIAFSSEPGGYQLRIGLSGLNAIKKVSSPEVWSKVRKVWSKDKETAPMLVHPVTFKALLRLDGHKRYPLSRSLPRLVLRLTLLEPMLAQMWFGVRLHFDGHDPEDGDILVAADGSSSQVFIGQRVQQSKTLRAIMSGGTLDPTVVFVHRIAPLYMSRLKTMGPDEYEKLMDPAYVYHPHTATQPLRRDQIVELDISLWPGGIIFDPGESMRLEFAGQGQILQDLDGVNEDLVKYNLGRHRLHTGGEYESQLLVNLWRSGQEDDITERA